MKKIYASENIYVMTSEITDAGRGVYARRDIKKGTIIETCPTIEISENDIAQLSESVLITYFFFYGKLKEKALVALGFGSLYNHSSKPNTIYKVHRTQQTIDFIALADIRKNTEITFDYNQGNPNHTPPLWFEHS